MVKISRLWGDANFSNLPNNSKLLYIYLITNPSINSAGVLALDINLVSVQLNMELDVLRSQTKELMDIDYVLVKEVRGVIYFIIPQHFHSLPKSDSVILKLQREIKTLPEEIKIILKEVGIESSRKVVEFTKPTEDEVLEYAMEQGYIISASTFINYYEDQAKKRGRKDVWINGRGKVVKDWKATLKKIWFKEENKLTEVKGAPKGYEHFYANYEGKIIIPDGWKEGKPYSKNFLHSRELNKVFNKLN